MLARSLHVQAAPVTTVLALLPYTVEHITRREYDMLSPENQFLESSHKSGFQRLKFSTVQQ